MGKKRLGYWIVGILLALVLFLPAFFILEDFFFSKKDMKNMLADSKITLYDDFKIHSRSISGIRDLYYEFEIVISDSDKIRLEKELMESEFYNENITAMDDIRAGKPRYSETDTFFLTIYQSSWYYEIQYYKPNQRGHTPIWDMIKISKTDNSLIFHRLLD
jgi:hypothetical protein